jgi:hypothetical protein
VPDDQRFQASHELVPLGDGRGIPAGGGTPLLIAPIRWGRAFKWELPDSRSDFTVYLGRCLGGVALVLVVFAFRASPEPEQHPCVVELLLSISAISAAIHIVGPAQGAQPWTENLEIAMYVAICASGLWLHLATWHRRTRPDDRVLRSDQAAPSGVARQPDAAARVLL